MIDRPHVLNALAMQTLDALDTLLERMARLPIPIVAAVNGAAAGGGCGIALAADIVLAARSSYFLAPFASIGLVPTSGLIWLLPRLFGRARASAMLMLGEHHGRRRGGQGAHLSGGRR